MPRPAAAALVVLAVAVAGHLHAAPRAPTAPRCAVAPHTAASPPLAPPRAPLRASPRPRGGRRAALRRLAAAPALGMLAAAAAPRRAAAAREGAVVFEASCAACHAGGGNVVARGKGLDRAALVANDAEDVEAIVRLGRKAMPGFGEACAPKPACTFGPRLAEEDIAAVARYVEARADDGRW